MWGSEVAQNSKLVGSCVHLLRTGKTTGVEEMLGDLKETEAFPTYATLKPESVWLHGSEPIDYLLNAVICRPETIVFPPSQILHTVTGRVVHACLEGVDRLSSQTSSTHAHWLRAS